MSKTDAEIMELDLLLAGKDEPDPADVARINREAMASLGMVGALPPRKRSE